MYNLKALCDYEANIIHNFFFWQEILYNIYKPSINTYNDLNHAAFDSIGSKEENISQYRVPCL